MNDFEEYPVEQPAAMSLEEAQGDSQFSLLNLVMPPENLIGQPPLPVEDRLAIQTREQMNQETKIKPEYQALRGLPAECAGYVDQRGNLLFKFPAHMGAVSVDRNCQLQSTHPTVKIGDNITMVKFPDGSKVICDSSTGKVTVVGANGQSALFGVGPRPQRPLQQQIPPGEVFPNGRLDLPALNIIGEIADAIRRQKK